MPPRSLLRFDYLQTGIQQIAILALCRDETYGYILRKRLAACNLSIEAGDFYRLMDRLCRQGYVSSWWGPSPIGHPRHLYITTTTGLDAFRSLVNEWVFLQALLLAVLRRETIVDLTTPDLIPPTSPAHTISQAAYLRSAMLYLFVLALCNEPNYAEHIARELTLLSLPVVPRSIHPVAARLVRAGLLSEDWETRQPYGGYGHPPRQRHFFKTTPAGASALLELRAHWTSLQRSLVPLIAPVTAPTPSTPGPGQTAM